MGRDATDIFHPLIAEWFRSRFPAPTEAQEGAWPLIAEGRNVLLSAPTGTGKTYSAFLYAINQLVSGSWAGGAVRVLYVSPLKALNTDIRVNLTGPLEEITGRFRDAGHPVPELLVQTRSGDTPEAERRRMLRRPPEILITTPESLNLILTSPNARTLLTGLRTLIVDEIHSVLDSKRGTHLITGVERLVPLAGEFQRIGLSATVRPIDAAAAFLGGYRAVRDGSGWRYEQREVAVVKAERSKRISLRVRYPGPVAARARQSDPAAASTAGPKTAAEGRGEAFWTLLAGELRPIIEGGGQGGPSSTLIFVNSRRTAERLAHEINEGQTSLLAYPHHGSLSREVRNVVEKRMKAGELKAIVATSSLELGIDIGELDEVLLVETPMSVAGAIQRVGRAGHSVGETSSGTLFASHGMDLLRAAVVAPMVEAQEIEEIRPIIAPLDVLAQVILSMTAISIWKLDELYAFLRTAFPYQSLTRRQFDLVVEMLEGRYAESRVRELSSRISVDRIDGTVKAKEGVRYLLYSGGGTIPDRGYFGLHVRDSGAKIGELDEEFVWERRVGDAFVLGSQRWRIVAVDHQRVTVIPWKGSVNSSPFWKAERQLRSFYFSERIGRSLARWEEVLAAGGTIAKEVPGAMEPPAVEELERFLKLQRTATGCPLPHRHHLLVEHTGGKGSARYLLIHTLWGGQVNEPLALALKAILRRDALPLDVGADNETIVIMLPEELSVAGAANEPPAPPGEGLPTVAELLRRLATEDLRALIGDELEASGFFGARFRENAGRALLLPRLRRGRRMPLWVTRLRAKRLLERVQGYTDFPIVAETWRECIRDVFDLQSLSLLLEEVRSNATGISETWTAAPSPFAAGIVWLQTNQFLYGDDTPAGPGARRGGSLTQELLREMVFTPELRVQIPRESAVEFERKLKRTAPGYAPRDPREIVDWLKERLLIPEEEWKELLEAVERDGGPDAAEVEAACAGRIVTVDFPGGGRFIAALEQRPRIERAFFSEQSADSLSRLLGEWLTFYGPISLAHLDNLFGVGSVGGAVDRSRFEWAVEELCDEESVVRGELLEGSEAIELCDAENMQHLLSYSRRERAVTIETRPFEELFPFLAEWQGLRAAPLPGRSVPLEGLLPTVLERLFGFPVKAALWETDLLPARLPGYRTPALDRLLGETELEWWGCGREAVSFRFRSDVDLFSEAVRSAAADRDGAAGTEKTGDRTEAAADSSTGARRAFAEARARYTYWDLQTRSGLAPEAFTRQLWQEVWTGRISSDSFEAVRRGAMNGFRTPERRSAAATGGRRFSRWRAQTTVPGTWYLTGVSDAASGEGAGDRDLIAELELKKDRVRLLLDRYGVIFRELLERELPPMRWGRLFRCLRLLELSGEIISGRFFDGIPGLQFASRTAVERLGESAASEESKRVYWMSAVDPASPCGLGLAAAATLELPSRLPSTHLVFYGSRLLLVSKRLGLELSIRVPPGSDELVHCRCLFDALLERDFQPRSAVKVRRVNGLPVRESPYRGALISLGFEEDFKNFTYRGGDV